MTAMAGLKPKHFLWQVEGRIARVRLDRPERKNPLTFESYAELRDTFRDLVYADDVDAVVFLSNGGNFCSGGDVHDIIGPLVAMDMKELLAFTRMTGDLVKAMLNCGKPIIAAVDGVAVGAGAIIAMASDIRIATPEAKTAFLFTRVGLAGCDMGACAILPRIIGQGRAAELLYTGRTMTAAEGERWGFYNRLVDAAALEADALELARAHRRRARPSPTASPRRSSTRNGRWGSTRRSRRRRRRRRSACRPRDFERAYRAFVAKQKPVFEGNVTMLRPHRSHRHIRPRSASAAAISRHSCLDGFGYPERLNAGVELDRPHGREGLRRPHRVDRQRPAAYLQGAVRLDQPARARTGRGLRREARQTRADPFRQQSGDGRLLAGGDQGRRCRGQYHADAARRRTHARSSTRRRSRSRCATRG